MSQKVNSKITNRTIDFAQWYTDIIRQADLCDYGDDNGSSKGTIVFRPYGYAIWENFQAILNHKFKLLGVQNLMFPMLITEKAFAREQELIAGFAPECAIVTKVGNKNLAEPLIIRPTSEVMFCQQFQRVVKSYKQLPLLYNQWCSVIRWEKTPRPFLRNNEFLWQEGHTVHASADEALAFAKQMIQLYAQFVEEYLAIKVILGTKTAHERFAGALETFTIETMMQDGQALQTGTSHYFGQKFAQAFNIKFNNEQNQSEFVFQTSWGVSTRLIGALIMAQSDDLGLILPSKIAPTTIIILNLHPKDSAVTAFSNEVANFLKPHFTLVVNNDDKSGSFKKSEAQIKGIPLMIEIGKQEVANHEVKLINRDDSSVTKLPLNQTLVPKITDLLSAIDQRLLAKSTKQFVTNLQEFTTFQAYQSAIKNLKGYAIAPFCGDIACETAIKAKTNTTSRCVPFDQYKQPENCFYCQQPNSPWTYFARAY